jgi:outer membrane protein assembly factor BamD (BamD/ComL family)
MKSSQSEPLTVAALRRDRVRLKGEVEQLRGQRQLMDDFLANLFGALEKEDYPQALAYIDRFLRTHSGHPLLERVSNLRIAVERIQSIATERESLRQEIRKLKDIQFKFEGLRKEGK